MSGRVVVGCAGFQGERRRYQKELDLVEIQETFLARPRPRTLRRWRGEAPAGFTFTMRAWQVVTHPPGSAGYRRLPPPLRARLREGGHLGPAPAVAEAAAVTLGAAEALGAAAVLFETPASFTPTREHRARLARFFGGLQRPPGVALVWKPQGVWRAEETVAICRDLELVPGLDEAALGLAAEADGPIYLRLQAPRHDEAHLARVADALLAAPGPAWCVVASSRPLPEARSLAAMIPTA